MTVVRSTRAAKSSADPMATARVALDAATLAVQHAVAGLADAKRAEAVALDAFVADASLEGPLRTARLAVERAEIIVAQRQIDETTTRAEVERLEREASVAQYEQAIARATSWPAKLAPALAKLAELDAAIAKLVETDIADVVLDQRSSFEEAERLETILRPVVGLSARNVTAISIADVKHLGRVFLSHARRTGGRDDVADGWTLGEPEPAWNHPARPAWDRALQLLDLNKGESK